MNEPNSKQATSPETTLGQDVLALVSHWLRGRRGWVLLGLAAVAGGLWIGWPSLVAAGVAPLLLGMLPCVAIFPGERARVAFSAVEPGMFMYHCHNLEHEDGAMMRNFLMT